MNRVTLFVGEFGSGKTELALNYAIYLKDQGFSTAIVDIDLVKPYFRTRENAAMLEGRGIKVVSPEKRLANADLPILPSELASTLSDPAYHVVMDVGGGESAVVLGQFRQGINELKPDILMVVNTRRPFTSSPEGIIATLQRIEKVSGLTVTGLVSNANLGTETNKNHVYEGYRIVSHTAAELKLPLKFVVIPDWLDGKICIDAPIFSLHPYTQYPWMG